jgi:hypothetical protein
VPNFMESKIIYYCSSYPEPFWQEGLLAFLSKVWKPYTFTAKHIDKKYYILCNYVGETELQEQTFEALCKIITESAKGWNDGYLCGERDANRIHAEEAAGADL